MENEREEKETESTLSPYRVLDLTDEKGLLCGKILGDLGADVVKIERPGGDPARNTGPFYHDMPDPEKSLLWFAYNTSKRGITLNIETADGREIFKSLVSRADLVIESFSPGHLNRLGLGYAALSKINHRVILTSITPFGQAGPYKDYEASDIILAAMGDMMYSYGDADRGPVRMSCDQTYLQASVHAAVGSLMALLARRLIGEGQHVDVSIQESCSVVPLCPDIAYWQLAHFITPRLGPCRFRGRITQRDIWPCKDGHIAFRLLGGVVPGGLRPLVEWMDSEGKAGVLNEVKDWSKVDVLKMSQEEADSWEKAFGQFFLSHTKAEILEEALRRGLFILPGYTPDETVADKQLAARDYWINVLHPELGDTITYPGAPYKFGHGRWYMTRRAPLIGEHNEEIYCQELGFSKEELCFLKQGNII